METVIIICFALAIGFYIGWKARGVSMIVKFIANPQSLRDLADEVEELRKDIDQKSEGELRHQLALVEVNTEQHNGEWYAWTSEGEFLGQGTDLEAILKAASKRTPNRAFWCKELDKNVQTS